MTLQTALTVSCELVTKKPELLTSVSVQPNVEDHVDHTIESKSGDGDCKHAER